MASQRFDLTFDAKLQVGQMKSALAEVQNSLNSLHLPQNLEKGFSNTINKITSEIQNFEVAINKGLTGKTDFTKLERNADRIVSLFERLKLQVKDIGNLSGDQLKQLFPDSVSNSITKATTALTKFNKELTDTSKEVVSADKKVKTLEQKLAQMKNATPMPKDKFKELSDSAKAAEAEVNELTQKFNELAETKTKLETTLSSPNKSSKYRTTIKELEEVGKKLEEANIKAKELNNQKVSALTFEKQAKEIQNLTSRLEEAKQKYDEFQSKLNNLNSTNTDGGLTKLFKELEELTGQDLSNVEKTIENAGLVIQNYFTKNVEEAQSRLQQFQGSVGKVNAPMQTFTQGMHESSDAVEEFNNRAKDIDQLKYRIQYFFGLNNAIQLVRRTIRSAYQTISELDKAMTETAVVTDFTVADMWAQLPEYTKRANELGVATLDAYKAATLYYQQGLKTNEVTALSNETLKMARIAGLDAAEATDRMTNALRGFNMALTETNAQRVDDVYSQLAANTASNVDEISTAMTKVASLAHNANMEFENTAAFLAQIIETTRESAETAGTALKTVVARFSEVKKLVSQDELLGKDEEGQTIDVNKVSTALRSAGIDLNKYFLGEVGLDDIFIELASKWDSLTSVQQRYIATQAAGSRQQSRFIALMSDYARTQELTALAYNSSGAAAKQFEKTQDSLQSKLARLKNAWNEFTMSITNSSLVKFGVDVLTNLLNIVNSLTSGFGTLTNGVGSFVNALAKIGVVVAGLKIGRALTGGIFNSLIHGGSFKEGVVRTIFGQNLPQGINAKDVTIGQMGGQMFGGLFRRRQGFLANSTRMATGYNFVGDLDTPEDLSSVTGSIAYTPKTMFGALGNRFIGTKMGGALAAKLGFSGAAAGAATLGVAIAGVTVAAGVAAAAIYQLYHISPQGQIAAAKKYAQAMQEVAKSAEAASKANEENFEEYKKYSDNINKAKTPNQLSNAYQERNDYLTGLLQENKDYLKYITSTFKDGKLILTLDEDSFEKYIAEGEEKARQATATSYLANATEAFKEYSMAQNTADMIGRMLQQPGRSYYSEEDRIKFLNTASEKKALFENQAQSAFAQMLPSDLETETANALSNVLAKSFNADDWYNAIESQRRNNWWNGQGGKEALRKQYKELYGVEADSNMKRADLARAVAQGQVSQNQQERTETVSNLVAGNEAYQNILNAISGTGKITEINLSNVNEEDFISKLGLDEGLFDSLADALGIEKTELTDLIKATGNLVKQIQQTNKAKVFQKVFESGRKLDSAQIEYINSLSPKDTENYLNMLEAGQQLLSPEQYQELASTRYTGDQLEEVSNFFNSINLESPIAAFEKLQDAIKGTNNTLSEYANQILEANQDTFNLGNLVQSFIASADYEELTDSLSDFIEKNGEITSANIDELAESSKALKKVLDLDGISVQGLAKALTALEKGETTFDALTESVLKALSAGEDFESLITNIHNTIQDFDAGIDFGEGSDFIKDQAEALTELINAYEFGNERTRKIYTQLFGENGWQSFVGQSERLAADELSKYGLANIERLQKLAEYNSLEFMRQATTMGLGVSGTTTGYDFTWDLSQFSTTADLLDQVATKFQVSTDSARMLVEGFAAQSIDFAQEWNNLNYDTQVKEFVESFKNTRAVTEQQLDLMAKATDKTADQIWEDLSNAFGAEGKEIPIRVNWIDKDGKPLTGESLIEEINNTIGNVTPKISYKGEQGHTFGGIDAKKFKEILEEYGLAEAQAIEYINSVAAASTEKLVKDVTVPIYELTKDGNIHVDHKTVKVEANTWEELTEAENAALESAKYDMVGQSIVSQDLSPLGANLYNTLVTAGRNAASTIQTTLNGISFTIEPQIKKSEVNGYVSTAYLRGPAANGGEVKSLASGSKELIPGPALTGEEGPEIVWNKNKGYAYVTGANGAQLQYLQAGDKVFTAEETRRILSKTNYRSKIFGSYAKGAYNEDVANGINGGDATKVEAWKNELDRLFNLLENIEEEERKQTKLNSDYDILLSDINTTSKDLLNNRAELLESYYTQYQQEAARYLERDRDLLEYLSENEEYRGYVDYDFNTNTLDIEWGLINSLAEGDKEKYDKISEIANHAKEIEQDRDRAEDSMRDIEKQIRELQNLWRDSYVDLIKRVREALIASYQQVIDNYSELNDTLNKTASDILSSLQDEISLQRQIRDNTKTEEDINEKEARLAYLRRDTTGKNAQEILQLEKELSNSRENYGDSLVDQSIQRLQDENSKAAEQREHQIEIMQAQLDYQVKNGEFNDQVLELIQTGIDQNGHPIQDSEMVKLLQDNENWGSLTELEQTIWNEELTKATTQAQSFLQGGEFQNSLAEALAKINITKDSINTIVGFGNNLTTEELNPIVDGIVEAIKINGEDIKAQIAGYQKAANYEGSGSSSGGTGTGGVSNIGVNPPSNQYKVIDANGNTVGQFSSEEEAKKFLQDKTQKAYDNYHSAFLIWKNNPNGGDNETIKEQRKAEYNRWLGATVKKYKTGGLNTSTGFAWLDGTKSKPEYVLNADQTDAFLKLAEVLPQLLRAPSSTVNTKVAGDVYLDLVMNVDEIADDYDVDKIADRIKEIIYDSSTYRNVNVINFIK